jgi:membrane protein YdbS with pleckstrin-like domain
MAADNPDPSASSSPVTTVNTVDLSPRSAEVSPNFDGASQADEIPDPKGTDAEAENRVSRDNNTDPTTGTGVEGEIVVWEARYSKRNFIGRLIVRTILTIAWLVLAVFTWGRGHENLAVPAWMALAVIVVLWIALVYRMVQAHYSHYYRLTNRRLFVSTGIVNRRRDMMELLRVKDVFTRQQSLTERWLGLGSVVVVPSEKELPTFYITGVDDPKQVMDLIWHHARSERDERSVKVDRV